MREMTGGCLCGKVRYSATAEPGFVALCHCKSCQKQGGTAFSVVVGVPRGALAIEGETRTYQHLGDSGQQVERHFCPACGSPISSELAVMPSLTFIKAGTLDDTSWLDPQTEVYCDEAQPWLPVRESSQRYAKMPG
jgi:hypothetical protein